MNEFFFYFSFKYASEGEKNRVVQFLHATSIFLDLFFYSGDQTFLNIILCLNNNETPTLKNYKMVYVYNMKILLLLLVNPQ